MIRTIDISNYVPPFVAEYSEMEQIYSAESEVLQSIENEHWRAVDNRFFVTADEEGIARFEKLLDVNPLQNDTLKSRRFRIAAFWNSKLPYNWKFLIDKLVTLCGETGYEIEYANFKMKVTVEIGVKNMINDVRTMLDNVLPCNIEWEVVQKYRTHEDIANLGLTHGELAAYTHHELRNEVINVG